MLARFKAHQHVEHVMCGIPYGFSFHRVSVHQFFNRAYHVKICLDDSLNYQNYKAF